MVGGFSPSYTDYSCRRGKIPDQYSEQLRIIVWCADPMYIKVYPPPLPLSTLPLPSLSTSLHPHLPLLPPPPLLHHPPFPLHTLPPLTFHHQYIALLESASLWMEWWMQGKNVMMATQSTTMAARAVSSTQSNSTQTPPRVAITALSSSIQMKSCIQLTQHCSNST